MNLTQRYSEMDQTEFYMKRMIFEGFVDESGAPLKCQYCGHNELETSGECYEEHRLVEYAVICSSCGKQVGYFAYGGWEV